MGLCRGLPVAVLLMLTAQGHGTSHNDSCDRDSGLSCSGETFRLLLVGKTGSGKSTTGNIILEEQRFKTSLKMTSETTHCQLERAQKHGMMLEIMDSPGLFDTSKTHEEVALRIVQSVAAMNPGPHAVLYVVPIGQRYTEEEFNAYRRLKKYFGEEITKHMIVLLSHGNKLREEGVSVEDYVKDTTKEFLQVLTECGNRYVVFDKYVQDNKTQVDNLFSKVRAMVRQNGGGHFQSALTQTVEEQMREFVNQVLQESEQQELGDKQTVVNLNQQRAEAERIAGEERERAQAAERTRQDAERRAGEERVRAEKAENFRQEAERKAEEERRRARAAEKARQDAEWRVKQQIARGGRGGGGGNFLEKLVGGIVAVLGSVLGLLKLF